ncbi:MULTISPECIES: transporter substrate-binding domain-containing protein [unclassified Bradyrhizobium]|uniref:transporter substrate-binding domain-containing protein n=1 Tax=unclassified Bradyrhizobium TaxID=2631580 RepID=UPI00102E964B|nr:MULTISPECIES: transporter substrate-binding domain-containing protein [unclassified Bradyrhizobium]MDI4235441.1 transporter substrate-binding domain-containing protein [Bradyrhizobium sp. Arg237L]TAI67317.1 amino acid ABC transporter substrate-binding protein [Bradyrhizobium sp. Leo170]
MMDSETWRVGILFSETGVTGAIERTQRAATLLAIEEINAAGGVCGRPIEPVAYDPASTPSRYRELTVKLLDEDRVRVIFGGHMSSTRKAMLPVVEARGALMFYPTLYEGFEYSRHCIFTGAAPNQNSVQLVDYLTKNYGGRVFLVGSNYVYPYESNRIIADLFAGAGGHAVDEMYVPLSLTDGHIAKILDRVRTMKPDVIYSTIVGAGIVPFYTAFKDAGFDGRQLPIASQSTSEADVVLMRPDVAEGHVTAAPFFQTIDTPAASAFVDAYHKRVGKDWPMTAPAEAAYFSVHLFAAALERSRSDHLEELLRSLWEVEYDAPQGPVRIDANTNHTHLWPRVARVDATGNYRVVHDAGVRVPPDPFMLEVRFKHEPGSAWALSY